MPLFTSQNAKENALKSADSRKLNKQREKERKEELAKYAAGAESIADYPANRLATVRAQLAKLDAMIFEEKDPQKLDRLASAQARIAKQEQELSGRPLPGSYRPAKKTPSKSHSIPDPID